MKKTILSILSLTFIIACKDAKSNDNFIDIEEVNTVETKNKIINTSSEEERNAKVLITTDVLEETIRTFKNCKATSTKRSDCRNAITEFVSSTYKINDFKDKENNNVIYDSIQSIVSRSSKWNKLGSVTKQKNIDKALEHTNNGGLALIVDTSETYGHVVVVLKGEAKNSGSWGLKLPQVLSLTNFSPSKSFHNKSLAYAFKKSNDLQVFLRK